jgi:hypothetical protein
VLPDAVLRRMQAAVDAARTRAADPADGTDLSDLANEADDADVPAAPADPQSLGGQVWTG